MAGDWIIKDGREGRWEDEWIKFEREGMDILQFFVNQLTIGNCYKHAGRIDDRI